MSDLEQRIKEAAEKDKQSGGATLFHAADILALLAEKYAEIERLTQERDEWKRIAERYREVDRFDAASFFEGSDCDCVICKAYDALAKGE